MAYSQASLASETNQKKFLARMTAREEELLEFFNNYFSNLRVTLQDIKVPKSDRMWVIYEAFMKDFGINCENFNVCPVTSFESELVEHQDEAVFICKYYAVMNKLLSCTGLDGLLIKDLTDPKPKRTKLILSLLKNLWEYANHYYNKYLDRKTDLVKEVEDIKEYINKREELKSKLNMIKAKQAEDQVQIKQLQDMNSQLEQQLALKYNNKINLLKQIDEHKVSFANSKTQLSEMAVKSAELKEQEQELGKRILQSPEKEAVALQKMEQREVDERQRKVEKHEKMLEAANLVERFKIMKDELNLAMDLINNRHEDIENMKQLCAKQQDFMKFHEEKNDMIQKNHNEISRRKRLVGIKLETESKMQIQYSRKISSLSESVGSLQMQVSKMKQKESQCSQLKSQQIETLMEIENKIEEVQKSMEDLQVESSKTYEALLLKVENEHSELLKIIS